MPSDSTRSHQQPERGVCARCSACSRQSVSLRALCFGHSSGHGGCAADYRKPSLRYSILSGCLRSLCLVVLSAVLFVGGCWQLVRGYPTFLEDYIFIAENPFEKVLPQYLTVNDSITLDEAAAVTHFGDREHLRLRLHALQRHGRVERFTVGRQTLWRKTNGQE